MDTGEGSHGTVETAEAGGFEPYRRDPYQALRCALPGGYHYPVGLVSSGVTALSGWSVRAAIVPWVTDRWVRPRLSLSAPSRTTCLVDGSLLLAPMLTGFVFD